MSYQVKTYLELRDKINQAKQDMRVLLDTVAIAKCPFKIGQEIIITGYSHKGKNGIVGSVSGSFSDYSEKIEWNIKGTVLKKDGTESMMHFEDSEGSYNMNMGISNAKPKNL